MISLVTTAPEAMYQPDGLQGVFADLRRSTLELATSLAKTQNYKVIVFDQDGEEFSEEKAAHAGDLTIANVIKGSATGESRQDLAPMLSLIGLSETVIGVGRRRPHLVAIIDTDYHFYPKSELGSFTERLDNWPELFGLLNSFGEYLGALDGDLLLVSALSQYPQRLKEFVENYGWSWVRHRAGQFEDVCGPLPLSLKGACSRDERALDTEDWSKPMTIQQLAKRFGVHRNTMSKYINEKRFPSRKVRGLYQVPTNFLPSK